LGIKRLLVYGDSLVVINQINDEWDQNKENMDAYCKEVHKLENKFLGLEFHHVFRDNNIAVDVHKPSIREPETATTVGENPPDRKIMIIGVDWRTPFIDYIREHKLPSDKTQAEQIS
jgi:hypothetical protein